MTAGFTNGLTPQLNIVQGEIVKNLLKYGAVSVSEQLAEMAVGLRPKFDFRLVASAMAAQTLNVELGLSEAHTPLESASQTTVNSAVAAITYGQTPDIEMLAAQALGTMIGYSAGNPLAATLRNARYANDAEFRHSEQAKVQQRLQQAAQGQSMHPSSRDNQQPVPQQTKPAKRSLTMFDKEQVKACVNDELLLDELFPSKPKSEKDPAILATERAKRWQSEARSASRWEATKGRLKEHAMSFLDDVHHPYENMVKPLLELDRDFYTSIYDPAAAKRMEARYSAMWQGAKGTVTGLFSSDPVKQGRALADVSFFVGSSLVGGEGIGVISTGVKTSIRVSHASKYYGLWNGIKVATTKVKTPYGVAYQSVTKEALEARISIENGSTLYRGGVLGRSAGPEGQFWATESPLNPGYANKYGIPTENINFNFVEAGTAKQNAIFITREAPGIGINTGGAVEAVTEVGSVKIKYFTMG